MASENETVVEIVSEMKHGNNRLAMQQVVMREYAERVEASHKREIAGLVAALKALAADTCGHCDARYCQATCHNGEPQIPCRVVYESLELVRKYSPPEPPQEEKE